jgi:hypothetical protein
MAVERKRMTAEDKRFFDAPPIREVERLRKIAGPGAGL